MRAKFILKVPATAPDKFPTNAELEKRLLLLGLGRADAADDYEKRLVAYVKAAETEWSHLPELAEDERDHVLFQARLPHYSRLLMTRYDEGYVVVRVINSELGRLLHAAEGLVKDLHAKMGMLPGFEIDHDLVEVYEKGENHVILRGQVVTSVTWEALRRDPQSAVTTAVTGVMSLLSLFALARVGIHPGLWEGTLERFSTAMLATFFVSLAVLVRVYWTVRRSGLIVWGADDVRLKS